MYRNDTVYYPKDEMTTVLLPVTSGCSYNKCAFCSMYKDDKYCEVSFSDIKMQLLNIYKYTERVFLTGADPMSIGFDKMMELLEMIHYYLPYCACVASYASIKNISKYSVEELSILHDAGLRMLYIGFETGSDDILKLMNKNHTVNEAIKQAKKLNKAKIPFNSIIMYGMAGKGKSIDNAVATAKMINQFNTTRVITMNLTIFEGTELNNMVKRGDYISSDKKERLVEIRTLLENFEPKKLMIFDTTHPTNIVKIKGTLKQDRGRLIDEITKYIQK
ncbi:radical SAM protein [Sedimentibacter sp. MB31-C6]|uniref:radical SAM protein n=1 Tax=Sedimentibacter sp. MB31-C6 TaxID=3109366 RepID=UPI002DDD160F|nr:radical SAM protein [Sedimentibacter sp. MB36-C1]WSI03211.1 radical SAM protein [Sedimentibacter sp. MB36-C1]